MPTIPSQNKPLTTFNQQDHFLEFLMEKKIPVFIFLKNGVRLKGFIHGFDNYIILFGYILEQRIINQQMIYKHAISTISGDYSTSESTILSKVIMNYT